MPNSITDYELSPNLELQELWTKILFDNSITHTHKPYSM